jgi:RimJ/RimL family protein N-acetyltransferase
MDPLDAVAWPVLTQRLSIRRSTPDDAGATWRWRRLPEVGEWITRAPADFEVYREQFTDPARLAVTLVIERDGVPIGDLMVRVEDGWAQAEVVDQGRGVQAELGWTLDPAHHGKGLATEAVRGAIEMCFGQLGLRRVHAGCFAANEPSWRLMERLGMRREEFSRKTGLHRSGQWLDGMDYGLLAEEWAARDGADLARAATHETP